MLCRIWYPFALCAPHAPDKTQKKAKEAKRRSREGGLGFRLLLIVATICDNDLGCQFLMSQFVYCLWRPLAAAMPAAAADPWPTLLDTPTNCLSISAAAANVRCNDCYILLCHFIAICGCNCYIVSRPHGSAHWVNSLGPKEGEGWVAGAGQALHRVCCCCGCLLSA